MSEGTWEKLAQVAVEGAEHDSRERLPHPHCLEGTRVNLLNYIYGVLDDKSNNRLIWLHGTAGVGKSAVAFTVAERMRSLKVTVETNVEMRLAGTFFFSRKHTNRRTTGRLFATLAYQLASNFPSVRTHVNKAIFENPALLQPNGSLRKQMEALFLRPLRQLKSRLCDSLPLAFVIDALDECTEYFDQSTPESLDQSTIEPFDENKSEIELAELISLLAKALRDPDLPATHILVTSRSEAHIHEAMQHEVVRPLVCEIPVKISGQGVAATISLDGEDVDEDIYLFLEHSFMKMHSRFPAFPQPTKVQLERLANRAGRRFIVASTMMKFIDDRHNDPYDRLELMLELASDLLPGTEVYKLYDRILSTCADPTQAYLHLSVVAAFADPLPMSQISKLLGPGQGRDVERVLVQLRSVIDVPTDNSLPVNIYHSSVRDYVSHPSNCSLPQVKYITSPHSLLALSSLHLMVREIPESTALLDALSELNGHKQAVESHDPQNLNDSLSFMVQPPEPLQVLIGLLWLRGHRSSELRFWLETLDGRAWLQTAGAKDWLLTQGGQDWLLTDGGLLTQWGKAWLQSQDVRVWLQTEGGRSWLQTEGGRAWMPTAGGRSWLRSEIRQLLLLTAGSRNWLLTEDGRAWLLLTEEGHSWLRSEIGRTLLLTTGGQSWLRTEDGRAWLLTEGGYSWLRTEGGRAWLPTEGGYSWLRTEGERVWLPTEGGQSWLETEGGQEWLLTEGGHIWLEAAGKDWLLTKGGQSWLETERGQDWLLTKGGQSWLETERGQDWLLTDGRIQLLLRQLEWAWPQSRVVRMWLQTKDGQRWLRTQHGQVWLQTEGGQSWFETEGGQDGLQNHDQQHSLQTLGLKDFDASQLSSLPPPHPSSFSIPQPPSLLPLSTADLVQTWDESWLQIHGVRNLQTPDEQDWLQTQAGRHWLQTQAGCHWLQTQVGQDWLKSHAARKCLQTLGRRDWPQTRSGGSWLLTLHGRCWLQTQSGEDWLQTRGGQDWLQTRCGQDWLLILGGEDWLQADGGRDWLQAEGGRDWLQAEGGRKWLETEGGRDWLQSQGGRDWLLTPYGQAWRLSTIWVTMEEFSSTFEALREYIITPDVRLHPAFQVIQQFKSLPDFLMFPAFLALRHQDHSLEASLQSHLPPDIEIIHAMKVFSSFAYKAREESRSASDALNYACQNWVVHISQAPNPWDERLSHTFQSFWDRNLLPWFARQLCLKDLRYCLTMLSEGEKIAKQHLQTSGLSE